MSKPGVEVLISGSFVEQLISKHARGVGMLGVVSSHV